MKIPTLLGLALIVLGIISLAYQGITYTTQKKIVDIGSIHATENEKKTIPLPPVLGCVTLLGGVALIVLGPKKNG
jgi:hypothetical protein